VAPPERKGHPEAAASAPGCLRGEQELVGGHGSGWHSGPMPNAEGPLWTAWGFIGAATLPMGTLDLGSNVRIETPDAARLEQLWQEAPRLQHPTVPWPEYFSALQSQVIVRSTRVIWFRLVASTFESALDRMESDEIPIVIAALAEYGTVRPRIELLRIGRTDAKGRIDKPSSPWVGGTFGGFATRGLTEAESRAVSLRHASARRYAAELSRMYYQASQQLDRSDRTPRSLGNVILNYFLVVEAIAQREPIEGNISGRDKETAAAEISRLGIALAKAAAPDVHVQKIRASLRKLERLEQRHLNQKIELAAARLGLGATILADALEVAQLRNTTLGHPGRELSASINPFVEKAEGTALAFLSAYISSRMA